MTNRVLGDELFTPEEPEQNREGRLVLRVILEAGALEVHRVVLSAVGRVGLEEAERQWQSELFEPAMLRPVVVELREDALLGLLEAGRARADQLVAWRIPRIGPRVAARNCSLPSRPSR